MMPAQKNLNLVPFVSVDDMMKIVLHIGVEAVLRDIAEYVEQDFKRWDLFDKTPRIASHSAEGVIELMPTSDGAVYGFKYVNGHPKKHEGGPSDRHGLWRPFRCRQRLSHSRVGNDHFDGFANGGHFSACGPLSGARGF